MRIIVPAAKLLWSSSDFYQEQISYATFHKAQLNVIIDPHCWRPLKKNLFFISMYINKELLSAIDTNQYKDSLLFSKPWKLAFSLILL